MKTTNLSNLASSQITIGIDLGDRKHAVHVLDHNGNCIQECKISNTREKLIQLSTQFPQSTIAFECGMHSPWISWLFEERGHTVYVANPRKMRAIYTNERKSDELDAKMLARLARFDSELLYPIKHQSAQAQQDFLQIKLRDNLVRQRVDIISSIRFTLKALGIKLASPKTSCFARRARIALQEEFPDILELIEPSLQVIDCIDHQVKSLDKSIKRLIETSYPQALHLQQIVGVGDLTSLAFVLVVGDPHQFESNRDVGAYLGLVPKRDQSGNLDKQLRISQAGNSYLRRLLVSAAQYIMGPFGQDCDLRRKGLELASRGGQRAKKKAVIAVARKLAVMMLSLWKNNSVYQPLRNDKQAAA